MAFALETRAAAPVGCHTSILHASPHFPHASAAPVSSPRNDLRESIGRRLILIHPTV